jgi:hypothetical protein
MKPILIRTFQFPTSNTNMVNARTFKEEATLESLILGPEIINFDNWKYAPFMVVVLWNVKLHRDRSKILFRQ